MHAGVSMPVLRGAKVLLMIIMGAVFLTGCQVRPEAIETLEAWKQAKQDVDTLVKEQEPITEGVGLYEAMARAIKYNRERRLKLMETALSSRQLELAHFDMLPELAANAGYKGRDKVQASSSYSIETGTESLEPSTSSDRNNWTSDVTFSWSVLDFGLSYVRAEQQADRHLIAKEKERKAVHLLMRDVRKAWWEALSAQRLLKQIDPLMGKVEEALVEARKIEVERLQNPLDALNYQRSLLQILRTLQSLRKQLSEAKVQLATLMGMPLVRIYDVEEPVGDFTVPAVSWTDQDMEQAALVLRPELMQARYDANITSKEARAALLGLLPDLKLDLGWNWDRNSYLVHNTWTSYGASVGYNLLNTFKLKPTFEAIEAREEVAYERRMAMSATVLMQVNLAKVGSIQANRLFMLSKEYHDVQERILKQVQATADATTGHQMLIREELNQVLSQVRLDAAYAEVQDSFGRLLVSLGIDPVPAEVDSLEVGALAKSIRTNIEAWQKRDLSQYLGLDESRAIQKAAAAQHETTELAAAHVQESAEPVEQSSGAAIEEAVAAAVAAEAAKEKAAAGKPADEVTEALNRQDVAPAETTFVQPGPEGTVAVEPAPIKKAEIEPMEVTTTESTVAKAAARSEAPLDLVVPVAAPAENKPAKIEEQPEPVVESKTMPASESVKVDEPKAQAGEKIGVITVRRLTTRAQPSKDAYVAGRSLTKGEKVRIIGSNKGWYNVIESQGAKSWVYGKYVRIVNQ